VEIGSIGTPGAIAAPFSVQCGRGSVEITTLQPAGKKPMSATDFLRGHPLTTGDCSLKADGPA
jgi:methionyl-tRNA formyltransferase